jgi:hypothetical protein
MDLMIDIETLGTSIGSVILTIGAVRFDRRSDTEYESFYKKISVDSCKRNGMMIDQSTVDWWNTQSEEVRNEAFYSEPREELEQVLAELSAFIKRTGVSYIWAQGPTFDVCMLEDAYKRCNLPIPWKFWNVRDTRTVYDLFKVKLEPDAGAHNALADCKRQIKGVRTALKTNFRV